MAYGHDNDATDAGQFGGRHTPPLARRPTLRTSLTTRLTAKSAVIGSASILPGKASFC